MLFCFFLQSISINRNLVSYHFAQLVITYQKWLDSPLSYNHLVINTMKWLIYQYNANNSSNLIKIHCAFKERTQRYFCISNCKFLMHQLVQTQYYNYHQIYFYYLHNHLRILYSILKISNNSKNSIHCHFKY